jgi:hypothetical protein
MHERQRLQRRSHGNEHDTDRRPAQLEQRPAFAGESPGRVSDGAAGQPSAPTLGHRFADVRVYPDTEADQVARSADVADVATAETGAAAKPLDEAIGPVGRARMESRLGADFSNVTVSRAQPGELAPGALAATRGEQIQLGAGGGMDLDTREGTFLAGHELTHVVQQRGGTAPAGATQAKRFGAGNIDVLEAEADLAGAKVARGEPAGPILGHAAPRAQFFGADEHEAMGNRGSGNSSVKLADDYSLSFGEVVALAGDHFASIEQMREFAKNTSGGKGSRLEIDYARNWKLNKGLPWKKGDPKYDEAQAAQEKRYYALAGGNQPGYGGNMSHFVNPGEGDMQRGTADKALDQTVQKEERFDSRGISSFIDGIGGKGAIAAYRYNHVMAIIDAVIAGNNKQDISAALATDAFACHYLTDSFASGHLRTPRMGAKQYWDPKVPMFFDNLVSFMAQYVYRELDSNWSPDWPADFVTEQLGQGGAEKKVRNVFAKKAPLTFGDLVGLAIHDSDNELGIKATVGGVQTKLVGDGAVLDKGMVTAEGKDTMDAVSKAVELSVADIRAAHAQGLAGAQPIDAIKARYNAATKMFAAETQIPTLTPQDLADKDNPEIKWKFGTVDDLLSSGPFVRALKVFAKEKAGELKEAGFEGNELKAVEKLGAALIADPVKIMVLVINYTPDTGGGIAGHDSDDNARDYVAKAQKMNALGTLTSTQRINLIIDVYHGWDSEDDEETAWKLLETAPDTDARRVIKYIGWDDLVGFFDGVEDTKFRQRFPETSYR